MWFVNCRGEREFRGGMEDWPGAVHAASRCHSFRSDVEEEQIAEEPRSCYNCRYRRWTAASFTCNGQGGS